MGIPDGAIYRYTFTVPADALDTLGHVNNVVWVAWMQDAAQRHSADCGGTAALSPTGCSWVARSHHIEYLAPAFADETIELLTWVADFRRVRSRRRYRFRNAATGQLLVRGETDWVFIDLRSGRPRSVPDEVARCYVVWAGEELS